jgi:UDP-N-acetylmuramoyl-tripeptide--D-alanyl-D-alanine ligase
MIGATLEQAARWTEGALIGSDRGFRGVSTDSRRLGSGQLFVALRGERFDGHRFVSAALDSGAAGALVSTDVGGLQPRVRVDDTTRALGRLAACWRRGLEVTLVGITGSNGKTTVKEMLASILGRCGPVLANRGNLNNQIGLPLTLLELGPEQRFAVVEMGASAAGEIGYLAAVARPRVAVVNNAGSAHLEGFGSVDGVARAKGEIFSGLGAGGVAVFNGDDRCAPLWRSLTEGRRRLEFGLSPGRDVGATDVDAARGLFTLCYGSRRQQVRLRFPGRHNVMNALAAAAAAVALGVELDTVRRGLEATAQVPGRLQTLPGACGATVVDDTYNANPDSLIAALEVIGQRDGVHWLVLGDMAELGPGGAELHAGVGARAKSLGFTRLYACGALAESAVHGFGAGGRHYPALQALCSDLLEALGGSPDAVTILVKGSRSTRMERVVAVLTDTGVVV